MDTIHGVNSKPIPKQQVFKLYQEYQTKQEQNLLPEDNIEKVKEISSFLMPIYVKEKLKTYKKNT